jgi:AraC family transcriptional regulator, transcriptional activator of pobA
MESLAEFYQRNLHWVPDTLRNEIGHFNVLLLDPYVGQGARPVPYKRRDFYKIMLAVGRGEVHYADRTVTVQKQALSFSSPQIPYKWTSTDQIERGVFCIFNQHFFHQFGDLNQYSVFQPQGRHLFELTDEQVERVQGIYDRMFEEIQSDYLHKYDVLRNLVFELLHFALKLVPSADFTQQPTHAARRITTLFLELLERQFPIDEHHTTVRLRTASDFARQLNVHVNHLNRAVKETTEKTTTQMLSERFLQEAKVLLKHSHWPIAEIAYALGFSEVSHFNHFFKKQLGITPTQFRKA